MRMSFGRLQQLCRWHDAGFSAGGGCGYVSLGKREVKVSPRHLQKLMAPSIHHHQEKAAQKVQVTEPPRTLKLKPPRGARRPAARVKATNTQNRPSSSSGKEGGSSSSPGQGSPSPGDDGGGEEESDSSDGEPPQLALLRCLNREKGLLESIRSKIDALLSLEEVPS